MPFSSMRIYEVKGSLPDERADWLESRCMGFDDPVTFFPAFESGSVVLSVVLKEVEQGVAARALLECGHYTIIRSSHRDNIISLVSRGFPVQCKTCGGAA